MTSGYRTVVITAPIAQWKLDEINPLAEHVHYHPDNNVPDEVLEQAEIWFTTWTGFPSNVTRLDQIPNTKVIQLTSGESLHDKVEADMQRERTNCYSRRL
jgi:hypothetical protein